MGEVVSLDERRRRKLEADPWRRAALDALAKAGDCSRRIVGTALGSAHMPGVTMRVSLNGQPMQQVGDSTVFCAYCAPDELCAMHSPTSGDLNQGLYFPPPGVDC